ncbi:MAG: MATE family efflux transporter [Angelakisella sp.]|nr:MATE family efflux transporter [Angelakisella sp.]
MSFMKTLGDRQLRTSLLGIALPVALQNLITYMTNMMDTVMLGQLGEVQLSAAAMSNQFSTIFMVLTFGIASGTNILLSQYWGKGDTKSMRSILAIMYRVTVVLSLIFFLAARFFPEFILGIFTPDAEVIAEGARYMRIACYATAFNGVTNVILMTLRSVGTVRPSIAIYTVSLFTNTLFNYMLIFGNLGAPRLEMRGAAIATVLARGLELGLAMYYLLKIESKIKITPKAILHYDRTFLRDYSGTVAPVMLNELLWSLGNSMLMVVMGQMSRSFVSANSITNVTMQFVQIFIIGVSNATAVIIGNTIGAEEYQKAKDIAKGMIVLSMILGILAGGILWLVRSVVVSFYNIPPESKALAMEIMSVAALIVMFQALTFTGLMGILRGGGDARFVLFCDVAFLWLFSIPVGFLAGLQWGFPPAAVYLILKGDEVLKLLFGLPRIWSGKWVRNLTR